MPNSIQLLEIGSIAAAAVGATVLLARKSQMQFAVGSAVLFFGAFGLSLFYPLEVFSSGRFWMEAYTTVFPSVAALYAIAQLAIWRGFSRPGWLSFVCTLPVALLIASAGFWEQIQ